MACNLFVALRIEDGNFDGQLVVGVVVDAHNLCRHLDLRLALRERESASIGSPRVDILFARGDEGYGAEQACARIPTAALFDILQMHLDSVVALAQKAGYVESERVVAISPIASIFAVDEHTRLSHGSIENEHGMRWQLLKIYGGAIEALPYPRKRSRTSRLLGFLFFAILNNGNILQVPLLVEWSANSPIVRNDYVFPFHAIMRKLPIPDVQRRTLLGVGIKRHA